MKNDVRIYEKKEPPTNKIITRVSTKANRKGPAFFAASMHQSHKSQTLDNNRYAGGGGYKYRN